MGNQQCCQAANKGEQNHEKVQLVDYHPEILPQLSEPIKKLLAQKKPFEQQLKAEPEIVTKQYGEQFYEGPVDHKTDRPSGYGKLYKKDGSLVIAHFKQGKTQGPAIVIFPNGSYYEGNLVDNKAQDQKGRFVNESLVYEGGFHQNAFNGNGKESGNGYTFQGEYVNGRKVKGILSWKQGEQVYEYNGSFNENFQFSNYGQLKQGTVGVYKGNFLNGLKHGTGIYTYIKNDVRYEGEYKDGKKSGNGTIYNHDNTIAYSGNFQNDLPNGQGYVIDNGKKSYAHFKDGLDIERLPA